MDRADAERPRIREARESLESIEAVRSRRGALVPPRWLHWALGACMVVEGLAQLLVGPTRIVVQVTVVVAILALSVAAQRRSGVVSRLTRLPRRPVAVWVVFTAAVVGAVLLTRAAGRVGFGPLGYFAFALFIVLVGPRLSALWGRWA